MVKSLNLVYILSMYCAIFLLPIVKTNLIEPEKYIEKVTEQMVSYLEKELVDQMLPIDDYNTKVKVARFGQSAIGDIRFHSGFVVSIDTAVLDEETYEKYLGDTESVVKATFRLSGVNLAYDVNYNLENNIKGNATFLIRYNDISFKLISTKKHNEQNAEGTMEYTSAGSGHFELIVKTDSSVPEVILIARHLRYSPKFRGPIGMTFNKWIDPLQQTLNKAVLNIEFPKIDYFT